MTVYIIHENDTWIPPFRKAFESLQLPFVEWNLSETHEIKSLTLMQSISIAFHHHHTHAIIVILVKLQTKYSNICLYIHVELLTINEHLHLNYPKLNNMLN